MENFKLIFESYGGDYETTMDRFMGKEELYLKILNMLSRDDNMQKLEDALQKGNLPDAFDAAHTLKGVAGNLGLAPLFEAVCRIVEPLRIREPREDYPVLFQEIQSEFQKAEQLRAALVRCREEDMPR
ncbi:Hpt domain-containing protein [Lacrimispora sp. NSJ-141]|uniref:Hpt domain-containing protein n=1 Tax=Lientehia hominis TaxID=2897778 RepID=A0AAP2W7Z2_9FIRM|nr:Hpt domain-containing protein [Lientehia hominis]MCD2491590.1 Hpt domain-containing protein [Lientehia hominis]